MRKIKWVLENTKLIYYRVFYIFRRFALIKFLFYLLLFSVDKYQRAHVKESSNSKRLLIIHLMDRKSYYRIILGILIGNHIIRDATMKLWKM